MKLYKLTDVNDCTYGGCQWGENVTIKTDGKGGLCGPGFTHWYTCPLLAVFLNPIHGDFNLETAHLWEGEGEIARNDHGLKVGCVEATTLRRIPLPRVSIEQRVRFCILCVKRTYNDPAWNEWADKWLGGSDRSAETARHLAVAQVCMLAGARACLLAAVRAVARAEMGGEAVAQAVRWAAMDVGVDLQAMAQEATRGK